MKPAIISKVFPIRVSKQSEIQRHHLAKLMDDHLERENIVLAFKLGIIFTDENGNRDWFGFLKALREVGNEKLVEVNLLSRGNE